jgi:hypothetical protein
LGKQWRRKDVMHIWKNRGDRWRYKSVIFLNRLNYCTHVTRRWQDTHRPLKCISLQSHTCVGNLMLPLNCTWSVNKRMFSIENFQWPLYSYRNGNGRHYNVELNNKINYPLICSNTWVLTQKPLAGRLKMTGITCVSFK